MAASGFTFIDILVVVILLGSAVYATYRGFVSETLSIFAWVAGAFATLYFGHYGAALLEPLISPEWIGTVLGYLAVFVAVLIPLEFLSHRISQTVQHSPVSTLDRVLGFAFGIVRGAVVIGLLYFLFSSFQPVREQPDWMLEARTYPYIQEASALVLSLAPDYVDTKELSVPEPRNKNTAEPKENKNTKKAKTYGAQERHALDSLIENTLSADEEQR